MKNNITFSLTLLALSCLQANAAATVATPPSAVTADGTDYSNLDAGSIIELGEVMDPLQMGEIVLCLTNIGGAHLVDQTTAYRALGDFNNCQSSSEPGRVTATKFTIIPAAKVVGLPQKTDMWITMTPEGITERYQLKTAISAGVSADNHLGVWQIDWQKLDSSGANGNTNSGHIKSAAGALGNQYTFASIDNEDGDGSMELLASFSRASQTSGSGRTRITRTGHSNAERNGILNYTIAYDADFVHIKEKDGDTPEVCQSHRDTFESVFDYNLYDNTGALVDIQSNIEFATAAGKTGYMSSHTYFDSDKVVQTGYWFWIEDGGYPTTSTTNFQVRDKRANGKSYHLTINVSGTETYELTSIKDATTSIEHVFDNEIVFDTSNVDTPLTTVINPLTGRNDSEYDLLKSDFAYDSMVYAGPGRLYGGPDGNERNFADGTRLTSMAEPHNSAGYANKDYYLKASFIENQPKTATEGSCLRLAGAMTAAALQELPTSADILGNAPPVITEPVVTGPPLVTDGKLTPE